MTVRGKRKAVVTTALLVAVVGATSGLILARATNGDTAAPKGWIECESPKGYTIAYPGGWFTDHLTKAQACMLFDDERFTLEPNAEWPAVALEVIASDERFARRIKTLTDPSDRETLLDEKATIAGHDAVRLKVRITEHGILPKGAIVYALVLDVDGKAFVVQTVIPADTATAEADELIDVAEKAAASLTFA